MPLFLCLRQTAGGVLALEAFRFARAYFRIRRSPSGRAPVDSHDALSVFEAVDIDTRACGRGASSWGPRFTYGCSRQVRQLGYPLLIPSTVAPESLFERLRSGRGSSYWSRFRGVVRATPRG